VTFVNRRRHNAIAENATVAITPTTKSGITIALSFDIVPNFQKRKEERSIAKATRAIIFTSNTPPFTQFNACRMHSLMNDLP
jgi:hypothetical protein